MQGEKRIHLRRILEDAYKNNKDIREIMANLVMEKDDGGKEKTRPVNQSDYLLWKKNNNVVLRFFNCLKCPLSAS